MNNIIIVEGDSAIIKVAVFDSQNRPYDVSKFMAFLYVPGRDPIGGECEGNKVTFSIPKETIVEPVPFEIVIADGGDQVYTICQGSITVNKKTARG